MTKGGYLVSGSAAIASLPRNSFRRVFYAAFIRRDEFRTRADDAGRGTGRVLFLPPSTCPRRLSTWYSRARRDARKRAKPSDREECKKSIAASISMFDFSTQLPTGVATWLTKKGARAARPHPCRPGRMIDRSIGGNTRRSRRAISPRLSN